MVFYNTLTRAKEEFTPIGKTVGLYTCGPTVYNYAHIGNLRTYVFEDILERALVSQGYSVKRVMNITDVGHLTSDADEGEDKIDIAAAREHASVEKLILRYTDAFLGDLKKLNIRIPACTPRASEEIGEQIALIQELIKKGFAYDTPEAVYFDTAKFPAYGALTGQTLRDKKVGAREEVITNTNKNNPYDFALWFKRVGRFENHIQHWPSPWGDGFPGWHVECSALSRKYLGQPFDIHTGGVDHIGTHHTNEIAQSEAAYGVPLAHYWLHGEFLLVDGARMAKSVGNVYTITDIASRGFDPLAFRYLCLGAHYRSKMNFTWESLGAAQTSLRGALRIYFDLCDKAAHPHEISATNPTTEANTYRANFKAAIDDDLNTPQALAIFHEMLRSSLDTAEKLALYREFDAIFGLTEGRERPVIPEEIQEIAARREECRRNKQFEQSDALRKELDALGYVVEDTPRGPFLWPKNLK